MPALQRLFQGHFTPSSVAVVAISTFVVIAEAQLLDQLQVKVSVSIGLH